MATHTMEMAGVTAWVEVDQEKLPVYCAQQSEEGTTMTGWIPSEAGKEFTVHWFPGDVQFHTSGFVWVDGLMCPPGAMTTPDPPWTTATKRYTHTGPNEQRSLTFSNVQLTDDDAYLGQSVSQEMGEIRLAVRETEIVRKYEVEAGKAPNHTSKVPDGVMHERSKKGLGHFVKLGAGQPIPRHMTYNTKDVRIMASFIFRYRPIDVLRANCIAPLDPNRKRTIDEDEVIEIKNGDEDEDEDTPNVDEEIARLQVRLKQLEKGRTKKRVKVKHEVKQEEIILTEIDGVIDLT